MPPRWTGFWKKYPRWRSICCPTIIRELLRDRFSCRSPRCAKPNPPRTEWRRNSIARCGNCCAQPPECDLKEGHDWDLQVLRWLDELGYQEAWIGEHHTAPWEPHPSPDLLLAQAFLQTKNIRLGPGGFLLPYHHPAELANRVAMLDHLSEGRLNFGVAASGLPSDWAMFNVDGMSG